jgi:hypothetical protein
MSEHLVLKSAEVREVDPRRQGTIRIQPVYALSSRIGRRNSAKEYVS